MSFKSIILLLAAGQGILLSIAMFSKSLKWGKSNIFLGILVLVLSIEVLNDFALQFKYHASPNSFPFWILGSYLFIPPAVYFFFKCNFNNNFKITAAKLLLFLPAILEIIIESASAITYHVWDIRFNLIQYKSWFLFSEVLPLIGMVLVLIIYGIQLFSLTFENGKQKSKEFKKFIRKHFIVFGIFIALTVLWVMMVAGKQYIFNLVESLIVVCIYILGYIAYMNPLVFEIPRILQQTGNNALFSGYEPSEYLKRLTTLFETGKIYTYPKLTLKEVSVKLKCPTRFVSYLINTYYNTNFSEFVNQYRINEVIKKMQDPSEQNKNILGLAFESGFNSKSAFNQIFKEYTGKTPSEYTTAFQKQVQKHDSGRPEK